MRADTHLLASTDGYTTQAVSPGVDLQERRELEELIHGQPDDPSVRAGLIAHPTAMVRRMRSTDRFAISRVLPGPNDSAGRQTIAVCSIVLTDRDYLTLAAHDLWPIISATNLWRLETFASSRGVRLSVPVQSECRVSAFDIQLVDAWTRARSTPRGLAAVPGGADQDRAVLRLPSLLAEEDRADLLWGCRLLSAQAPVQIATFIRSASAASARRIVVELNPASRSAMGVALGGFVGSPGIPPLQTLMQRPPRPVTPAANVPGTFTSPAVPPPTVHKASTRIPLFIAAAMASLLIAASVGWIAWNRLRPPAPVQDVIARYDSTEHAVVLSWQQSPRAKSYRVDSREGPTGPWTLLELVAAAEGSSPVLVDRTVLPLAEATYRVTAVSEWDKESLAVESPPIRVPQPPLQRWSFNRTETGSIELSWEGVRGAEHWIVEVDTEPPDQLVASPKITGTSASFEPKPGATVTSLRLRAVFPRGMSEPYVLHDSSTPRISPPDGIPSGNMKVTGCPPKLQLEVRLPARVGCRIEWTGLQQPSLTEIVPSSPSQETSHQVDLTGDQTANVTVTLTPFTEDLQGRLEGPSTNWTMPWISPFKVEAVGEELVIVLERDPPEGWQACVEVLAGTSLKKSLVPAGEPTRFMMSASDLEPFRQLETEPISVAAWLTPLIPIDPPCDYPTTPRRQPAELPKIPAPEAAKEPRPAIDDIGPLFFCRDAYGNYPDLDEQPNSSSRCDLTFTERIAAVLKEEEVDAKLSKDKAKATRVLRQISIELVKHLEQVSAGTTLLACRLLDAPALMRTALFDYADLDEAEPGSAAPMILDEALKPIYDWCKRYESNLRPEARTTCSAPVTIDGWKGACKSNDLQLGTGAMGTAEQIAAEREAKCQCDALPREILSWGDTNVKANEKALRDIVGNLGNPTSPVCLKALPDIRYAAKRALLRSRGDPSDEETHRSGESPR